MVEREESTCGSSALVSSSETGMKICIKFDPFPGHNVCILDKARVLLFSLTERGHRTHRFLFATQLILANISLLSLLLLPTVLSLSLSLSFHGFSLVSQLLLTHFLVCESIFCAPDTRQVSLPLSFFFRRQTLFSRSKSRSKG